MGLFTILVFFVYCYGLGLTISFFVKNSDNFLERNLMRIGFGLAMIPFIALVFNLIRVPADWKIILIFSLIYPFYYIFKNYKNFNFSFKITKTNLGIFIMLVIFLANFYVYAKGAFSYPYLEDDDPWTHAIGVKFYSIEKNAFEAENIRYINPYPPAYDILVGILHQTNDSLYWTMKFFNALIIALSTVFFYFFVGEFTGNRNKALFATFALFSIPSFMSHFIWGITMAVPLYFVVFYALERIKHDSKWWIVAALTMATVLISSPTHSAYFGIFFILYLITKIIVEKKILIWHIAAGAAGLFLSFAVWWLHMITKHGVKGTIAGFGYRFKYGAIGLGGTGDRIYSFKDFFIARMENAINNPIGIGIVLFLLVVIALIFLIFKHWNYIKKHKMHIISIFSAVELITIVFLWKTYTGRLWGSLETLASPIPFFKFFLEQFFLIIAVSFILFILVSLIYLDYKENYYEDNHLILTLVWLAFSFYAVNAVTYHFKLSPFRAWMLLAIPICIFAAQGVVNLIGIPKKFFGSIGVYAVIALLIVGIYFTSAKQKIAINTSQWHPGGFWTSAEELQAYIWMKDNLPKNSKVFTFWNNAPVIGMDMYTCHWCDETINYMKTGFNQTAQENHDWLKRNDYQYLIVDGQTAVGFGANVSNEKIRAIAESELFRPVFQNNGAIIFRI